MLSQLQHNWTQLTYRAAAEPSLARGWPPTAARPSVPFQPCPENKESPRSYSPRAFTNIHKVTQNTQPQAGTASAGHLSLNDPS